MPSYLTIRGVTLTPEGQILVAAREGAYRSSDSGATWEHVTNGLPDKNISSISYDADSKRLLATSTATGVIFEARTAAAVGSAVRCRISAAPHQRGARALRGGYAI